MIQINNLNYKYKTGEFALSDINLNISDNEFICIIGHNGSGKSTFSKLLAGLTNFKNGEILIDELSANNKKNALQIRKKVSIVFQNPENQIFFDKVYDDLSFGLKNLGFSTNDIEIQIDESLRMVNMFDYKNAYTSELSLGQKQRIAIASALTTHPEILILDEPTTMLDQSSKVQIYNTLKTLKSKGITIIYITNFIDEVLLSDRILFFEQGKIKRDFQKKDILKNLDIIKKFDYPGIISIISELHSKGIDVNLEDLSTNELVDKLMKVKG